MKANILILHDGEVGLPGRGGCPRLYNFFKYNSDHFNAFLINLVDPGLAGAAIASVDMLKKDVRLQGLTQLPRNGRISRTGKIMHALTGRPCFYEGVRRRETFRGLRKYISRFCSEHSIKAIYTSSLSASQYCMGNGIPLVADIHDAISLLAWRSSRAGGTPGKRVREMAEAISTRRFEKKLSRASSFYVINSSIDFSYLAGFAEREKLVIIENGVDADHFSHRLPRKARNSLVFTGDLGYAPNEQAAYFLATRIFPPLRKRYGDLRLALVGRNPPPGILAFGEMPEVQVTGFVPDIRPYVWQAGIYVSPLRLGTGMKNKILEAMALGTPIVASEISCEGIEVESGKHLLMARTEEEFREAIRMIREDDELAERLSVQARRLVERRYCWDAKAQQLRELLEAASRKPQAQSGRRDAAGIGK